LENQFQTWILLALKRAKDEAFQVRFKDSGDRQLIWSRFSSHFVRILRSSVKILEVWVGINSKTVPSVCETGFADLRKTDKGYFGAGIYSTLQAEYARRYAMGLHSQEPVPPNENGEYTLILSWAAVANTYPVTRQEDYNKKKIASDFFDPEVGHALLPGFDSHCTTVDPSQNYQAASDISKTSNYDELVVKESQQMLPQFVVYFKKK